MNTAEEIDRTSLDSLARRTDTARLPTCSGPIALGHSSGAHLARIVIFATIIAVLLYSGRRDIAAFASEVVPRPSAHPVDATLLEH